jgi:hypothetical protein
MRTVPFVCTLEVYSTSILLLVKGFFDEFTRKIGLSAEYSVILHSGFKSDEPWLGTRQSHFIECGAKTAGRPAGNKCY